MASGAAPYHQRAAQGRGVADLLDELCGPGFAAEVCRLWASQSPVERLTAMWLHVRRADPALLGHMRVLEAMAPSYPAYQYTRLQLAESLEGVRFTSEEQAIFGELRVALVKESGLRALRRPARHLTYGEEAWPLAEVDRVDRAVSRALVGRTATRRVTLSSASRIGWLRAQEACALPIVLLHEEFHIGIAHRVGISRPGPPLAEILEEHVANLVEFLLRLRLYDHWPTYGALAEWLADDEDCHAVLLLARQTVDSDDDPVQLAPLVKLVAAGLRSPTDAHVAALLNRMAREPLPLSHWRRLLHQQDDSPPPRQC